MCAARLEAIGITKRFYQERLGRYTTVLEELNLAVGTGEFVSIVGTSGCGKTTLLHILDGLVPPTRGQILVEGAPVRGPGQDRAMVFQEDALLPWRTVLRNVTYGLECLGTDRREARRAAERCLELVGLGGFELHYPHELSGGMRQRVNLARALAVDPGILLMDEPFASLDAQTRETMQAELLAIWERTRKTVVFVTHQIGEAIYLSDRVLVLMGRPGRMQHVVNVDLPRPRDDGHRQSQCFRDLEGHLRSLLRSDREGRPR
jgi:NitT/TauT family transport system ATP-binding protein